MNKTCYLLAFAYLVRFWPIEAEASNLNFTALTKDIIFAGGITDTLRNRIDEVSQIPWSDIHRKNYGNESSALYILRQLATSYQDLSLAAQLPKYWLEALEFVAETSRNQDSLEFDAILAPEDLNPDDLQKLFIKPKGWEFYFGTNLSGLLPSGDIASLIQTNIAVTGFATPEFIRRSVLDKLEVQAFRYQHQGGTAYLEGTTQKHIHDFCNWQDKYYQWEIHPENCVQGRGVNAIFRSIVPLVSEQGDKILILNPTYGPLPNLIKSQDRNVESIPIHYSSENGRYKMPWDLLEIAANDPKAKALVIINPHNPTGYVLNEKDISRLEKIVLENDLVLISDEAHAEIIHDGRYIPLASFSEALAKHTISIHSPHKTFNIAKLHIAYAVTKIPDLAKGLKQSLGYTTFDLAAQGAADIVYTKSAKHYIDKVLRPYLKRNRDFFLRFLGDHVSEVKINPPQGTFVAFAHFSGVTSPFNKLVSHGILPEEGKSFGDEDGLRFNFALPRGQLAAMLVRLREVNWQD